MDNSKLYDLIVKSVLYGQHIQLQVGERMTSAMDYADKVMEEIGELEGV